MALSLTTALSLAAPDPAEARRRASPTEIIRDPAKNDPLTIVISLSEQRLNVYDSRGLVAQSPISSGRRGNETPTGIFTILQKNKQHYSNLYNSAPMPNMQRITWS
ncbi:MAG: L,D-transpeptidase family protein, partial [Hyphomicrobiaceae bacterium]|nr:L,D-transpeptidase family protein [Hyphomicrobiaceae bacterium]